MNQEKKVAFRKQVLFMLKNQFFCALLIFNDFNQKSHISKSRLLGVYIIWSSNVDDFQCQYPAICDIKKHLKINGLHPICLCQRVSYLKIPTYIPS